MGCTVELANALIRFEFCCEGKKQKILVDILLKYSDMDINELAFALDVSVSKILDICNESSFLMGKQADDLSQLFIIFFGRIFFRNFSIIRNF